jgi:hypothetical protein
MTEYPEPLHDMKQEQPCHLTLKDATVLVAVDLAKFDAPGQRYCSPMSIRSNVRQTERTLAFASTPELRGPATSRTSSGSRRRASNPVYPTCKEEKS